MSDWERYLRKPGGLKLFVIHTGFVHMAGNIHVNRKSPGFSSFPRDDRFNPVWCYLVQHPTKGYVLLDAGLHESFAKNRYGNFGFLLGSIVKTKTEAGKDVASQLRSIGVFPNDIGSIILSHLHLDHPSGLASFSGRDAPTVFIDEDEIRAASGPFSLFKGYIASHIRGFTVKNIDYSLTIPPFSPVSDFFGDGSLFIMKTPGHTPGHVSILLNMAGGPFLLTFDAAHRKSNIEELIPPKGDYTAALASVRAMRSFLERHPGTRIIFGHDPDQLSSLKLLPDYYV